MALDLYMMHLGFKYYGNARVRGCARGAPRAASPTPPRPQCEYPLDHFVTYMGVLGLSTIPLSTVNKLSIEARPQSKRQGASGSLQFFLLLVPLIQLIVCVASPLPTWPRGPSSRSADLAPAAASCLAAATPSASVRSRPLACPLRTARAPRPLCSHGPAAEPSSVTNDKATTQCEVDLYHFSYWYCLIALVLIAIFLWIIILIAVGLCLGSTWLVGYLPESLRNVRQTAEAHRREMHRDK